MATSAAGSLDFTRAKNDLRTYAATALLRLRLQAGLDAFALALTVSAWLLVLMLLSEKLFSLASMGINIWPLWGAVSVLGIPFLLWRMFSPQLHDRRAAVLSDHRLNLHARLSSALTLDFSDPANAQFGEAFLGEALRKMASVKVEQAFPLRFPRMMLWLLLPGLCAAGVYYFMKPQDILGVAAQAEQKRKADKLKVDTATKMEGKLVDLKKKVEAQEKEGPGNFKVKNLIEKADKLAKDLKAGERNPEDALISMGSLKRDIQDEKEKLQQGKDFLDRLEKLQANKLNLEESDLTKQVSEALKMGDPGQAAKEMRKLAQKIKDEILNNPNMSAEKKQQELEKLQREMEKLAGALADDKELSKDLYQIAKTAKNDPEYEKFQDEIKKALNKQKKNGKDLGEQLENDIDQAANELERLEEDNDVKLDDEDEGEMEKLDELEKGVDEAIDELSETGIKSDKAEQGDPNGEGQKAKSGQKGKSTKSGSMKGKKSMKGKSGQQQGKGDQPGQDGQNGQKGNGQGDNQNGPKDGKPGEGLGGGPGQGKRPYRDGDAEFEKQKLKGELRAGAITGISHFKGQGAKGDAPTEFVKALESAEKESASSLDLDRIPADARDMVKDYFSKVRDGANLPPPVPGTEPKK